MAVRLIDLPAMKSGVYASFIVALGAIALCTTQWIPLPSVAGESQETHLSYRAQLGKILFFDPSLSGSGRQSCASCHDPSNHYAPSNDLATQLGGVNLDRHGYRAVPSLTYLDEAPSFNAELTNPDGSATGPGGGFDWDGRMDTIAAQSLSALLTPYEMANKSEASVVEKIKRSDRYKSLFERAFSADIFDSSEDTFKAVGEALESFQREDASFHPYTSKYDYYARGLVSLTPQEMRGMAIFNDADRANCVACHTAGIAPGRGGTYSSGQFTDFFYRNLGMPRNADINYAAFSGFDLGLCGPFRTDLSEKVSRNNQKYCGMFATPTLRNTTTRHVYFHNGSFRSLRDVVEFYITRDITPQRWYHIKNGAIYDDLPESMQSLVDRNDMPFAMEKPGAKPVINESQVDDLVAFLKTLTDGYDVKSQKANAEPGK